MKILVGLTGTITSLTNVVIALLGLGIVLALLGGGDIPFLGEVANNIVGLVQGLGDWDDRVIVLVNNRQLPE